MDSKTLKNRGFETLESPLRNLEKIPEEAAIYVFCLKREIERLRGKTDIIYVGETSDLQNRMDEYSGNWKKRGGTGHRICKNLRRLGEHVNLFFKLAEKLNTPRREYEGQLLTEFSKEHHELPSWNRSGPKTWLNMHT